VHCVHNFEQPLLLWAVIAGLRAGPKLAADRAGPGRKMAWKLWAGPKIFGPCTSLVHSVVRCRKRTELQPQWTRAENFVKFGRLVFEMCEWTYRRAHRNILHRYQGRAWCRNTEHLWPWPCRKDSFWICVLVHVECY